MAKIGRAPNILEPYQDRTTNNVFREGTLKRLTLSNFMVHEKLALNFGPKITVLTGSNGSGKSAILQAVVIALGGSAKDSKRGGSNLSEFIRTGASRAVIQLTLSNSGFEAYKEELFGSEIVFERFIYSNGGSRQVVKSPITGYKLRGASASNVRDAILGHFFIDVSNPLVVLQQEEAKSFFQTCDEKILYDFLESGTLIRNLREGLTRIRSEKEKLVENFEWQMKKLLQFQSQLETLKKEKAKLQQTDVSEQRLQLDAKIRWGTFHDARRQLMKRKSEIEIENQYLETLAIALKRLNEQRSNFESEKFDIMTKNAQIESDIVTLTKEKNDLQNKIDTLTQQKLSAERELSDADLKFRRAEQTLQREKNRLRELRNSRLADREDSDMSKLLTKKKSDLARIQSRILELEKKQEMLDEQRPRLARQKAVLKSELKCIATEETKLRRLYSKEIESHDSEISKCFGVELDTVLNSIEKQKNKFSKPPIGPIGRFISLGHEASKDDHLGRVIEATLGRKFLNSFIVNSSQDSKILREIFSSSNLDLISSIFIVPFGKKKYAIGRDVASWDKVLVNLLDIQNPEVFNLTVDFHHVEKIVVMSDDEAMRRLSKRQLVPKNVEKAISKTFYSYVPASKKFPFWSYYIEPACGPSLLSCEKPRSKIEIKLSKIETKIFDRRNRMKEIEKELSKVDTDALEVRRDVCKEKCSRNMIDIDIRKLLDDARSAQSEAEDCQQRVKNYELEKTRLQETLTQCRRLKFGVSEELRKLSPKLNDVCKRLRDAKGKLIPIHDAEQGMKENFLEVEKIRAKIIHQENKLRSLKCSYQSLDDECKKFRQLAMESTSRTDMVVDENVHEILALKKRLEKAAAKNSSGGDLIQISTKMSEIDEEIQKLSKSRKESKFLERKIEHMITERSFSLDYMRENICRNLRRAFQDFNRNENIFADVDINTSHRTCSLKVGKSHDHHRIVPLCSLSGGERSKCLVYFIASLWKYIPAPFRCLDEYDVFLDDVAKVEVERLMFETASISEGQYIFISPHVPSTRHQDMMIVEIQNKK